MILKFVIITLTLLIANTSTSDLENLFKELEKAVRQNPNIANNFTAGDIDQVIGGAKKSALSSDETKGTTHSDSSCMLNVMMAYENRKICRLFYKLKKSHLTMKGRETVRLAQSSAPRDAQYDNITRIFVVEKDSDPFLVTLCSTIAGMLRTMRRDCAEYIKTEIECDFYEMVRPESMMENLLEQYGDELDPNGKCPARPEEPHIES